MIAETANYLSIVDQMPADTVVIFHNSTWEDYEELLAHVGEASGLHVSFNDGTLKVMTVSSGHEKYVRFIDSLISSLRLRLRINILSHGSATMKRKANKGNEPDASFYVQSAAAIGNRIDVDPAVDPPDVVVEVDIHHDSRDNYPIYAAFGVPEIWRYDGHEMTILQLQRDGYVSAETSRALPMLTSGVLTEYLRRMTEEGEFKAIIAFDEWLQSLPR